MRESSRASNIQCSATFSYALFTNGSLACAARCLASSAFRRQSTISDDIRAVLKWTEPSGKCGVARAAKETCRYGRTVIRASDFVLEVRKSPQCDFSISALNVCETLRDRWPCRAPFDIRFRRWSVLRFLAQRERPIHLSKFSALAAMPRGFCNRCKASKLFRLGAIILYLRPQRIDSGCTLQRLMHA
jgi:hypothetical protein